MINGKPSELRHAEPHHNEAFTETFAPSLNEFAKWLLADPHTLEVWCLAGARLARVECTVEETQTLELDSGDWFLVRVSGLPTTLPTSSALTGIIRCFRFGETDAPESASSGPGDE